MFRRAGTSAPAPQQRAGDQRSGASLSPDCRQHAPMGSRAAANRLLERTKLVFCLFAEDVGLLPTAVHSPQGIFTHIIEQARSKPAVFRQYVQNLFVAMNEGGNILMRDIPYFNGTLFNVVTVEELSVEALVALEKAAKLNWEAIEAFNLWHPLRAQSRPKQTLTIGRALYIARGYLAHRRTGADAAAPLRMGHEFNSNCPARPPAI